MPHQRTVIRQAVRDLLKNATDAGANVSTTRMRPHRKLPALSVYTLEESIDDDSASTAPRYLARQLSLVIEGWLTPGVETLDDRADELARQVEEVMHADPTLGDTVGDSVLVSTTIDVKETGDVQTGWFRMTYAVTYHTLAQLTDGVFDDLLSVGVVHDLAGAQAPADETADQVVVQEA